MQNILVYSDSLTWGIIPNTRKRLVFNQRWPGVFENELIKNELSIRVIENCLNGRRTVWSDPFKDGRDGSIGLAQIIEMHSPLDVVILMLGTNDFQNTHNNDAWMSAQGMDKLINIVRTAPIEPNMPIPEILVVAPPMINKPMGAISHKFKHAEKRCSNLTKELEKISEQNAVHFYDSNTVISASKVDGIHLDAEDHLILGKAIAEKVIKDCLLQKSNSTRTVKK